MESNSICVKIKRTIYSNGKEDKKLFYIIDK